VLAYRACGVSRTYEAAAPATTCGVRALLTLGSVAALQAF